MEAGFSSAFVSVSRKGATRTQQKPSKKKRKLSFSPQGFHEFAGALFAFQTTGVPCLYLPPPSPRGVRSLTSLDETRWGVLRRKTSAGHTKPTRGLGSKDPPLSLDVQTCPLPQATVRCLLSKGDRPWLALSVVEVGRRILDTVFPSHSPLPSLLVGIC